MKKLLLAVLFLLSHMPCQATQSSTSKLQKCIGATALLLSTLSGLENIKDKKCTKTSLDVLKILQKGLENHQAAKDLFDAITNKKYNLAIQLLQKKPSLDINARFSEVKYTALMWCFCKGNESIDVVKGILKHPKFDITIKDKDKSNYLHYACYYGLPKITSLLLKREDISNLLHAIDDEGYTPLDYIIYRVKDSQGQIGSITVWNMMVTKGAQLSKYKDEYKKLNSNDFKSPHSDYIEAIKSNSPRKVELQKHSLVRQNMNNNQEGMIQDTSGYQDEREMKDME